MVKTTQRDRTISSDPGLSKKTFQFVKIEENEQTPIRRKYNSLPSKLDQISTSSSSSVKPPVRSTSVEKNLRFGEAKYYNFPLTLGDNPSAARTPLRLAVEGEPAYSYTKSLKESKKITNNNSDKIVKKRFNFNPLMLLCFLHDRNKAKNPPIINAKDAEKALKSSGYSDREITSARGDALIIQFQREESLNDDFDDMDEQENPLTI